MPDANGVTPELSQPRVAHVKAAAQFFGGASLAFVAHELGHVASNFAFYNTPRIVGLTGLGFMPFFAISPDLRCNVSTCVRRDGTIFDAGRRGMYLISTAGFLVQAAGSEAVLSADPYLRHHVGPWRKGLLAFNVLLSVGYAAACMSGVEDAYGDAGGAAQVAGVSPYLFSSILLLPAVLDVYRYMVPSSRWAAWSSRASKLAMLGLSFTF